MKKIIVIALSLIIFISSKSFTQTVTLEGQLSGYLNYNADADDKTNSGLHYIPWLIISTGKGEDRGRIVDSEIAVNAFVSAPINKLDTLRDNSDLKFYRLSLRYATPQFESRIGLQKINFGSAKILRSLMWFDKLDPRDPLKLTDGVYGWLNRFYFQNNANIWLWGLYGNEDLKGLETIKSNKHIPEVGGRYQFPIPKGEFAVSYHHRYLEQTLDNSENRFAIDGNWDIGMGLWLEACVGDLATKTDSHLWQKFVTVGADYTLKNGMHLLYEQFAQASGTEISKSGQHSNSSAISVNYVVSIIDSLNAIAYYDWQQNKLYPFIGWQRTYDNWLFNLSAFSSQDSSSTMFKGTGIQFMVTYNH